MKYVLCVFSAAVAAIGWGCGASSADAGQTDTTSSALSTSNSSTSPNSGGFQPPQAAIDACASLQAEQSCSFTMDSHAISGTCRSGPDNSNLACAPSDMPPPVPPAAAVEACAGLQASSSCSFTMDSRTITGTCRSGPDNSNLACAPSDMPAPPKPPQAAVEACANLQASSSCSFTMDSRNFSGICRSGPDGSLACAPARNQ